MFVFHDLTWKVFEIPSLQCLFIKRFNSLMLISTLLLNNSSSASGTPRQEAFSTGWLLSTGEEKQQQT